MRMPEVAAAQVMALLRQDRPEAVAAAAQLSQAHQIPLSQARVHLAQGDASAALAVLEPYRQQVEARDWADERLKAMVLQALAHQANGETDNAAQWIGEALALAEPGGLIRTFVDEGLPMAQLLSEAAARGTRADYIAKLLAVFEAEAPQARAGRQASAAKSAEDPQPPPTRPVMEPLSQRELEVLQLIAQGHSNHEISERLFLALDTVKGHNRRIFEKLHVQRRTEAVARARELGLF
jgi:LuxR family maltose regulon positive regulatory protein